MSVRDETRLASDEPAPITTGLKRVVAASMAGTVVEWYEFFLYGTAATLVFSKVFFAKGDSDLDAILAAFLTYAVGFAARCGACSSTPVRRFRAEKKKFTWKPPITRGTIKLKY